MYSKLPCVCDRSALDTLRKNTGAVFRKGVTTEIKGSCNGMRIKGRRARLLFFELTTERTGGGGAEEARCSRVNVSASIAQPSKDIHKLQAAAKIVLLAER